MDMQAESLLNYDPFVISSVPTLVKSQAESLLNYLKKNPGVIQRDIRLVISCYGQKLEQSNEIELSHLIIL